MGPQPRRAAASGDADSADRRGPCPRPLPPRPFGRWHGRDHAGGDAGEDRRAPSDQEEAEENVLLHSHDAAGDTPHPGTDRRRPGYAPAHRRGAAVFALAAVVALVHVGPARGTSVVAEHSTTGVMLSADATIGFDGVGSTAGNDFLTVMDGALALPAIGPVATASAVAAMQSPPGGGDPKDGVSADTRLIFSFGQGVAGALVDDDTFRFDITGSASALAALNTVGNPADAVVEASATATFRLNATTRPDGDHVGNLQLPDLRPLDPLAFETLLAVRVLESAPPFNLPLPVAAMAAGDTGVTVPVLSGNQYAIELSYGLRVPHGVDPDFDLGSYIVTLHANIPAPGMLLPIAAVAMIGALKRRARRPV